MNREERRRQQKERGRQTGPQSLQSIAHTAARWPVESALVKSDWRESGSVGIVLLRRHPEGSRLAAALFYIDLWCMGVKSADAKIDVDIDELMRHLTRGEVRYDRASPDLVAAIVAAGSSFADSLGIAQDPDLPAVREMLRGLDPAKAQPVSGGRRGIPVYAPGLDDDVNAVLRSLQRARGGDFCYFPDGVRTLRDLSPAPGLVSTAARDDTQLGAALLRCGAIKEALVAFAQRLALDKASAPQTPLALDLSVLTGQTVHGQPILDVFLAYTDGLDEVEQALVRSWAHPIIDTFRVMQRDSDSLLLRGVTSGHQYVVRSNLGLGVMAQLPALEFVMAVLVPGPRDFLLSGTLAQLQTEEHASEIAQNIAAALGHHAPGTFVIQIDGDKILHGDERATVRSLKSTE